MIPILPGGLGFVEVGLTGTLPPSPGTRRLQGGGGALATLMYRPAPYWLLILLGLVAYGAFSSAPANSAARTIRR